MEEPDNSIRALASGEESIDNLKRELDYAWTQIKLWKEKCKRAKKEVFDDIYDNVLVLLLEEHCESCYLCDTCESEVKERIDTIKEKHLGV